MHSRKVQLVGRVAFRTHHTTEQFVKFQNVKGKKTPNKVRLFVLVIAGFSHKVGINGKAEAIAIYSDSRSLLNGICLHKIAHAQNCKYIEL